jgi:hypothetical protein
MSPTAVEKAREIKLMKMNESIKLAVNSTEHRDVYSEGNKVEVDANNCILGDNNISTFVEPTTKEKLRYLRYFRLVTHRKRNGKYNKYNRG